MSVRQNIGFSPDIVGETKVAIAQKVDAAAALLQLTPYPDRETAQSRHKPARAIRAWDQAGTHSARGT